MGRGAGEWGAMDDKHMVARPWADACEIGPHEGWKRGTRITRSWQDLEDADRSARTSIRRPLSCERAVQGAQISMARMNCLRAETAMPLRCAYHVADLLERMHGRLEAGVRRSRWSVHELGKDCIPRQD